MEEIIKEELTMSAVPKAVNYLIEEVAEMRAALDAEDHAVVAPVRDILPVREVPV